MSIDLNQYMFLTRETAIYPPEVALEYVILGLANEAGEVAGVLKKRLRGDYDEDVMREKLTKELGDVMWYFARVCDEVGIEPLEVLRVNHAKLSKRKENNTLKGDGDDR